MNASKFLIMYEIDLLFYIEAVRDAEMVPESFQVPTSDTVIEFRQQSLEPEKPHAMSVIKHEDLSQDVVIIVHLLLVMLNPETGKSTHLAGKLIRSNSNWALDCLIRIWRIIEPAQASIILVSSRNRCYSAFLKALCSCLEPLSRYRYEKTEMLQAAALLSDSILYLLQSNPAEMTVDLELAICWSIYDLLAIGNKFSGILEIYQERLGTSLHSEDDRRSYVDSLSLDLQVGSAFLLELIKLMWSAGTSACLESFCWWQTPESNYAISATVIGL